MSTTIRLYPDTYADSVVQLSATRAVRESDGVDWGAVAMATPGNLDTLTAEGFDTGELADAGVTDLFIAVRAADDGVIERAVAAGEEALFAPRRGSAPGTAAAPAARTMAEALDRAPGSNVAIVSVPGDYAALEAHKALTAGLDVLLFSDNVGVDAEVALKQRAERLGHLVMGPGAGTAMLGGIGLGFANVTGRDAAADRPRVAVVAAAGTGAQEAMSLLDRWGVTVTTVIGLGGRDLSKAVGGVMGRTALRALAGDAATDAVLLVSKPPDAEVAREVIRAAGGKPLVAALIGLREPIEVPAGTRLATTLESGVLTTLAVLGMPVPDTTVGLREQISAAIADLPAGRRCIRGLYSGGTLCYEALVILSSVLDEGHPVYSNTPLCAAHGLPAPPRSHQCLDLGEEEYTKGRPHPMIDPAARIELLRKHGDDPEVAAILLDVVIGHGSHDDPAGQLAPVCAAIRDAGGPAIVCYVLGTEGDPQGLERQRQTLRDAGCLVTETAARAALAAAAIAVRDASLAEVTL